MIHHVTYAIAPSSLDDCIDFYGILGFRRVAEPSGITDRAVWLEHAGTQIHLMPGDGVGVGVGVGAGAGVGHVAVVARDYAETLAALRGAGHEVEPRREHWGSPRAFVHDPAGHTVEVMAWPPGEAECGRRPRRPE